MGREDSDSSGLAVGVAVVLILLVVAGAVLVGGVWLARTSARTQALVAMQREAMALEEAARARAKLTATQASAEAPAAELNDAGGPMITIQIDGDAALRVEGEPAPLADLQERLAAAKPDGNTPPEVLLQVHPECKAASILEVIEICEEAGLMKVRLAHLAEAGE